MEHRSLGSTGLKVSEICLGTMQFLWTTDAVNSVAVLDAFVEAGGNFIDTADIYTSWAPGLKGGEAETVIGDWMRTRGNRRTIVLATKVRGRMWPGPNGEGLSRAHIVQACEDSLRRLGTDVIDLYQTHWPDDGTPIDETLRALDDLIHAGKVRYIGCSNIKGWQLVEALLVAREAGLAPYVTIQPHWSLAHRAEFEDDAYAVVRKYGLGVIPYSPLAAGFLTGKYREGQALPDSRRAGRVKRYLNPQGFALIAQLEALGLALGKTISQMALGWLLSMPNTTAPIVGANTPAQLAESLGAAGLRLTSDEMAALEAVTRAPTADPD
ncbi:MAG TPA: aldo/keto reductase [Anaerolineales bacterium]|nr:aldo/keto reductase [Anaerolineales bacterium]